MMEYYTLIWQKTAGKPYLDVLNVEMTTPNTRVKNIKKCFLASNGAI